MHDSEKKENVVNSKRYDKFIVDRTFPWFQARARARAERQIKTTLVYILVSNISFGERKAEWERCVLFLQDDRNKKRRQKNNNSPRFSLL